MEPKSTDLERGAATNRKRQRRAIKNPAGRASGVYLKLQAGYYTHLLSSEAPFTSILLAEITRLNTIEAWSPLPRASKLSV